MQPGVGTISIDRKCNHPEEEDIQRISMYLIYFRSSLCIFLTSLYNSSSLGLTDQEISSGKMLVVMVTVIFDIYLVI